MKIFFKWTITALAFLGTIVLFTMITSRFDKSRIWIVIISVIIGAILLGFIFYIIETKYLPWRRKQLIKKICQLFNATKITDSICRVELEGYTIFVHVQHQLKMSKTGGNMEIISFHISKTRLDNQQSKPDFELTPDRCNGMETYRIYQTNGLGLTIAKRKLLNRLRK